MWQTFNEKLEALKGQIIENDKKKVKTVKVLVLSLGVGGLFGTKDKAGELEKEQKKNMILNGKLEAYQPTIYSYSDMNGKEKTVPSAFVAEPLLEMFKPDEIVIIGTSKSAWTSFFRAFGDNDDKKNKNMADIFAFEGDGGKDIDVVEKKYADSIESIYQEGMTQHEGFKGKKIHVIVTRYGMNSGELLENYRIISEKMASILRDKDAEYEYEYEVAFDITHSFRSMPIYNLAILNYLQNTATAKLKISHVYYGNLEVKYENILEVEYENILQKKPVAPVLDLGELIDVMNLSGSVNEFKNTGNAASLLAHIPDTPENSGLRNALERFDLATQLNAYDKVMESLKELMKECESDDGSGKYADLRKMILSVLQKKFLEGIDMETFAKMFLGKKQYQLAKWYHSQNRYGQAMMTAVEAVRSYLVKIYVEAGMMSTGSKSIKNEDNRKSAFESYRNLANQCKTSDSEIKKKIYKFEMARRNAAPVRDMAAHNLGSDIVETRTKEGIKWEDIKENVDVFFEQLSGFIEMLETETDRKAFKELYIATIRKQEEIKACGGKATATQNAQKIQKGSNRK